MVKILLVDDSSFMRKILKTTLSKAGFTDFVEGTNGEEAIALYKKEKAKVCLCVW